MINWYRQKYILSIVICFVLGQQNSLLAREKSQTNSDSIDNLVESNQPQTKQILAQKTAVCQTIDPDYQEVYSFATQSHYMSICQLGSDFYYHRQSKTDTSNTLLIRAESVFGGGVFQATHEGTIYLIGLDSDRYYSSVMNDNSEIVFEPEVRPEVISTETTKNVAANITASSNSELELAEANQTLGNNNAHNVSSQSSICADRSSALHPHLNGWQKLIGKSSNSVNQYASSNGHNFIYNQDRPQAAAIETKSGELVNLNIAPANDTIDRVCVRPVIE